MNATTGPDSTAITTVTLALVQLIVRHWVLITTFAAALEVCGDPNLALALAALAVTNPPR